MNVERACWAKSSVISHVLLNSIYFFSPVIIATKKRKIDAECRFFNNEWGEKYFFIKSNDQNAICLICNDIVAVKKEYNVRRHYETKHLSIYSKYTGKMRSDKYESTRRSLESLRKLFTKKFAENHASHKIVTKLVEREKPFTDGAFIKDCILEAVNYLCPEKVNLFTGRGLSPSSVVRKVEELGANVKQQIHDKVKNFLWYSLALDESTDVSSTSQLLIFIRGVDTKLNITEELVSVCSMHGTAIGEDIFKEVQKTLQDYNLQ
uniref:general transcription factor II-I repeat domain-containing protein 2-like n=1 Tax=Styela clava TaxID=7725 RepID=UPI00193977D5|nr:general transcription factor II-I repeat domain-containing protein 2-like [Styela clava]